MRGSRSVLARFDDLLECRECGGYHAVPWCPNKRRRGDLPQTALSLDEAGALAPRSVPMPAAPAVNLDLFRATQEDLTL